MAVLDATIGLADGLDALDGVAYYTDLDGRLCGGSRRNWEDFSAAAQAPNAAWESVVGQNIFDIVVGDDVRELYRSIHNEVRSGVRQRVTFAYRCDAPDVERRMRMTVGALHRDGDLVGVLYHSQVVSQRQRPPLNLLTYREAALSLREDTAPILSICSFCHSVRPSSAERSWVTPEAYYQGGGVSEVRLSHGVCDPCHVRVLEEDGADAW